MLDDADDSPALDPDRVYRNYLKTCKRLGVTPTPRERAKALIEEWTDALTAAAGSDPRRSTRGMAPRIELFAFRYHDPHDGSSPSTGVAV